MKYRIKDTKTTIKIIGIYQIFGGILGVGLIGWLMLRTEVINGPVLFIFTLALFLFGFSVQSGNFLLQESKLKKGLIFSSILQGIQIIAIGLGNYTYEFYSGAKGTIGFEFGGGFKFNFGAAFSSFNFTINSENNDYFFKINILAIIILSILIDILKELKGKNKEFNSVGKVDTKLIDEKVQTEIENS